MEIIVLSVLCGIASLVIAAIFIAMPKIKKAYDFMIVLFSEFYLGFKEWKEWITRK